MSDLEIVLLLLASAVVMFAVGRPRMDAVALMMIVALPLTGVIGVKDAVAGFADSNIVLMGALRGRGGTRADGNGTAPWRLASASTPPFGTQIPLGASTPSAMTHSHTKPARQ
jgi:hypothetical protein